MCVHSRARGKILGMFCKFFGLLVSLFPYAAATVSEVALSDHALRLAS